MPDPFDPHHVWLGIPPEEQPPNHYRLLGLRAFEENRDVISNAVDQRRVFLRSVQGGKRAAQSQQLMNEVSTAGVVLLDQAKKTRYDEELRKKLSPRPAHVAAATPGGLPAGASLPDPMAPLAISTLLPPHAAVAGPAVRAMPKAAPPAPNSAPVVLTAPRLTSARPASPAALAIALVIGGVAVTLVVAGLAWWIMSRGPTNEIAAASTATTATAPSLPPPPPEAEPETTVSPPSTENRLPPAKISSRETSTVATNVPRTTNPPDSATTPSMPVKSTPPPEKTAKAPPAKPKAPTEGGRIPVPEPDALSTSEEAARKLYAKELKEATKPQQQMALANEIMNSGRATQNDVTARFVLIDLARTLFIQAGEVDQALTAARFLEIEYDIPREHLISSTLEAFDGVTMTPEQRLVMTKSAADLADRALDGEEFERADKLSTLAMQSATRIKDAEYRKDLQQRRNHIQKLVKEWNTLKPALDKLKDDPSDGAANLAAGRFYCFLLEDFAKGLRYLSASSDPLLSEAAKLDTAAQSADAAKRLEAAQAWQKAELKIVDRENKLAAQRRERWLLQNAVAGLSGLDQIKANKRLADLQEISGLSTGRKPGEMPAMPNKTKKKKTT